ncbi:MAG: Co2+/Mg2+ efflux protein ApaG [Chromatiales bacterium]|nr:Co2+/Mg2+ efflux protein ApaG [Chromatiales bacterium]
MPDTPQNQFSIDVNVTYIDEQSAPEEHRYVFAYTIHIENQGDTAARLIGRHWIITNADGKTQEVIGEGVVGQQPFLRPGENFSYTSSAAIETPVGSMHGSYQMRTENGEHFDAPIPAFSLAKPNTLH